MQFVEHYADNQVMSNEEIAEDAIKVANANTIDVKVYYEYNGPSDKGSSIIVKPGMAVDEVVKLLQNDYVNKAHTGEFSVVEVFDGTED